MGTSLVVIIKFKSNQIKSNPLPAPPSHSRVYKTSRAPPNTRKRISPTMQANRHLRRNHSRIVSSDSEADDNNNTVDEEMNNPETDPPSNEQNHPRTSLINNEDNSRTQ